jgi:exonuclease SbcC
MIPLQLTLNNFLCYEVATLNLDGLHFACLTGENGAGKSSILDAMTWALWGKARTHSDDNLVHSGEDRMAVSLTFDINGVKYRVQRMREIGKRGKSILELHTIDPAHALTGATIAETQTRINMILGIEYDTFINSALLLQGRADEFTLKAPTERKRILGDILGLGQYDTYEAIAKEHVQRQTATLAIIESQVASLKEAGSLLGEREKVHNATVQIVEKARSHLSETENALRKHEQDLAIIVQKEHELEFIKQELFNEKKRKDTLVGEITRIDTEYTGACNLLARQKDVEDGYKQWQEADKIAEQEREKYTQYVDLKNQLQETTKAIDIARNELCTKLSHVRQNLLDLNKIVDTLPLLRAELQTVEKDIAAGEVIKEQIESLQEQRSVLLQKHVRAEASLPVSDVLLKAKQRIVQLQDESSMCPVCKQPLDSNKRQQLLSEAEEELRVLTDTLEQCKREINSLFLEIQENEQKIQKLQSNATMRGLPEKRGSLMTQIVAAEAAFNNIHQIEKEEQDLVEQLATGISWRNYTSCEQELHKAFSALNYNYATFSNALEVKTKFEQFRTAHNDLASAQAIRDKDAETLTRLRKELADLVAKLEQYEHQAHDLGIHVAQKKSLEQVVANSTLDVKDVRRNLEKDQRDECLAAEELNRCQSAIAQLSYVQSQYDAMADTLQLYKTLALAFGKKGVQALLIDQAIPEIETESNDLLNCMTNGRMSLRLDTQRETKSGTTIETLDIYVSDEMGERVYEVFSGGEAFRINLALRIALSRVLARRAGTRLQTIIIDEGFGTQDDEGRRRLLEAIRSVHDQFALVLVVTHIDELKDAFPVRIEVTKGPHGSQITVQ